MDFIFAYLAGLLTLINPCVLPVLPIVLASALQAHRLGPVALAGGMAVTFVALGLTVAVAGQSLGLTERVLAQAGAVMMIGFGLMLLVPRLNAGFALVTAGMAARADAGIDRIDRNGLGGQALAGVLLGVVWSPCIGPTLGGAISLASQGRSLLYAAGVMVGFAAGVATVILALAYGVRAGFGRSVLRRIAGWAKPAMGITFILLGTAILLHWPKIAEGWLVENLPYWLTDFSVSL